MSQYRKNIVASAAGSLCSALLSFAVVPIYLRILGVESYGLIGFIATMQGVASALDFGLSDTLNRELAHRSVADESPDHSRDVLRTLEIIYWGVAILIGVVVVLISPFLAHHWLRAQRTQGTILEGALVIMGLIMLIQWPLSFYSGGLMGIQRQVLLNILNTAMAVLRSVGSIAVLLWVSRSLIAFLLWQLAVSAIQTSLTALYLWRSLPMGKHPPRFNGPLLKTLWRFGAGVTAITIVSVVLIQADKLVLSKLLTLEAFGYYSFAGIVSGGLYYLIKPLYSVSFSRFSQLIALGDTRALVDTYHQTCQLMSVLILPIGSVIAIFSREVVLFWTRNTRVADQTHLLVTVLMIGTILHGLMHIPYALQLSYGWTKLSFYQNLVSIALLIPLLVWACQRYGALGAAVVWVLLNVGYIVIGIRLMHARIIKGEGRRWYCWDIGAPMIGSVLGVTILRSTFRHTAPSAIPALLVVALCLAQLGAICTSPYARRELDKKRIGLLKFFASPYIPSSSVQGD